MEKFNAEKLKQMRDKKGWSLREAAAHLVLAGYDKTTYQTWQNWEEGKCQPGGSAVKGLADLLGVKMEAFFNVT